MFEFTKEKINQLLSIEAYQDFFEKVSKKEIVEAPYDEDTFFLYTEANFKRSVKIRNKVELDKKLYNELNEGTENWTWILITEPWCGDASFIENSFKRQRRRFNECLLNEWGKVHSETGRYR
jgi:hypothetical protein